MMVLQHLKRKRQKAGREKKKRGEKTKVRECVLILQASKMRISNVFLFKRTFKELHIIYIELNVYFGLNLGKQQNEPDTN